MNRRMARDDEEIGAQLRCECGATVWKEKVLKGDNIGQWRVVDLSGTRHRCGPDRRKRRPWTLEEERFVEANVGYMSESEIAERLNRPVIGVYQIVARINRRRRSRK